MSKQVLWPLVLVAVVCHRVLGCDGADIPLSGPRTRHSKKLLPSLKAILGLNGGSMQVQSNRHIRNMEYTPKHSLEAGVHDISDSAAFLNLMKQQEDWNQQIRRLRRSVAETQESAEETLSQIKGCIVNRLEGAQEEYDEMEARLSAFKDMVKRKMRVRIADLMPTVPLTTMNRFGRNLSNNLQFSWIASQLGGWDTCAIVSAETLLLSIYVWGQHRRIPFHERSIQSSLALAVGVLRKSVQYAGIAFGLHGTAVFALLSMNGRRALEAQSTRSKEHLDHARPSIAAFEEYLQRTLSCRKYGFWSVRISVCLTGIQLLFFLHSQFANPTLQWASVIILAVGAWNVFQQNQTIFYP